MCRRLAGSKRRLLMTCATAFASASLALLVAALGSDHWVRCRERIKSGAARAHWTNASDGVFYESHLGLWRWCTGVVDRNGLELSPLPACDYIPYFTGGGSASEASDSDTIVGGIVENVRLSALFPCLSTLVHAAGDGLCLAAYFCARRRMLLTFFSGIAFVLSGLSLLVCIILYLGAVTGEAGQNDDVGDDDVPDFSYAYGASFGVVVGSFITVEIAGVVSVYLFITQYRSSTADRRFVRRPAPTQTDLLRELLRRTKSTGGGQRTSVNSRRPSVLSCGSGFGGSGFGGSGSASPAATAMQRDTSKHTALTTIESAYNVASNGDSSHAAAESKHGDKYATTAV